MYFGQGSRGTGVGFLAFALIHRVIFPQPEASQRIHKWSRFMEPRDIDAYRSFLVLVFTMCKVQGRRAGPALTMRRICLVIVSAVAPDQAVSLHGVTNPG